MTIECSFKSEDMGIDVLADIAAHQIIADSGYGGGKHTVMYGRKVVNLLGNN